ncbi:hypothetical protein LZ32DRAFT_613611 [Colletotrichum eremochloae]|nr:hypothetical protein LZ32DRAFT_613611 [Colletotrichum eremochloae]
MHSKYHLFLLLWSLLSCTFAAPFSRERGLRYNGDIYTVAQDGDYYYVYTPYYGRRYHEAVTKLIFPHDDPGMITVLAAYNGKESPHPNGSPRLHLSDVIQAVASDRNAKRPLTSVNKMSGTTVVNKETLAVVNKYYQDWHKLNPGATFPETVTFTPSDSVWSSLQTTPFFKAVMWTFKGTGKTKSTTTT